MRLNQKLQVMFAVLPPLSKYKMHQKFEYVQCIGVISIKSWEMWNTGKFGILDQSFITFQRAFFVWIWGEEFIFFRDHICKQVYGRCKYKRKQDGRTQIALQCFNFVNKTQIKQVLLGCVPLEIHIQLSKLLSDDYDLVL